MEGLPHSIEGRQVVPSNTANSLPAQGSPATGPSLAPDSGDQSSMSTSNATPLSTTQILIDKNLNALYRRRVVRKEEEHTQADELAENAGPSKRPLNVFTMPSQPQTERTTPIEPPEFKNKLKQEKRFLAILNTNQQMQFNKLMSYDESVVNASGAGGVSAQEDNINKWLHFLSSLDTKQFDNLCTTEAWKEKPLKQRFAVGVFNFSNADDMCRSKDANCSEPCSYWMRAAENTIIRTDKANKELKGENSRVNEENEGLKMRNFQLLTLHEKCQLCGEAMKKIQELKNHMDWLNDKIQELQKYNLDWKSAFEKKENELKKLQAKTCTCGLELALKNHKTDTAMNKIGFKQTIHELQTSVSDLQTENQALRNRIAELEKQRPEDNTANNGDSMPNSPPSERYNDAELEEQATCYQGNNPSET